jgi:hypothetical protein
MSKKRNVQLVVDGGLNFGQAITHNDFTKMQDFAHLHPENLTRDFLTQFFEIDVAQFWIDSSIGLTANVAAGRIYQNGIQFDGDAVQVTFDAAHATLPRIDVIYATCVQDSSEELTSTPFQRIRTSLELTGGTPPYPPVQYEVPLEKHNKVVLAIKKGVAASSPVQPAMAAGEIPLWAVTIPANAVALVPGNFADLRRLAANLRQMRTELNQILDTLDDVGTSIETLQAYRYDLVNVNWLSSFGGVRTIHDVMLEIGQKLLVLKWRYPSILTGDGRVQAVGNLDGGVPVIDIPIGTLVQFGDKFLTIHADAFTDATLDARQVTTGIDNTNKLFDGMDDAFSLDNAQNTIRINAPNSTKYLYLGYDGSLYFKSTATGSNSNECMLLRSTPKGADAPELLAYINLRNAVLTKTGVATSSSSSKQFTNDIAQPPGVGYIKAYGVKPDNTMYVLNFDSITDYNQVVNVVGVDADGDTWVVEIYLNSVY